MRLLDDLNRPFDMDVPIHNWYYPLSTKKHPLASSGVRRFFEEAGSGSPSYTALYVHIPFCETICSFCPFIRKSVDDNNLIDTYMSLLHREIEVKSRLKSNAVTSIFIGGGTPSILTTRQIYELGDVIQSCFDLSKLREFSFEMEVKSVDGERLIALKEIGVTNVRLGVQTLQDHSRSLFELTASARDAEAALACMLEQFQMVSADILYAFDGQTEHDVEADINSILATGVPLIELYPLNPVVSQVRLHKRAAKMNLSPPTAEMRHQYRILAANMLRGADFVPHNGHGFVNSGLVPQCNRPTTDAYHFDYHEHVYGYKKYEILGIGANAISNIQGISLQNESSLHRYMRDVAADGVPQAILGCPDAHSWESRPLIFRLPYFGSVRKSEIDFHKVYPESLERLLDLIEYGLVEDSQHELSITQRGWEWYTSCMYYLLPGHERDQVDQEVENARGLSRPALDEENLIFKI